MNRRDFLKKTGVVTGAAVAAPVLANIPASELPGPAINTGGNTWEYSAGIHDEIFVRETDAPVHTRNLEGKLWWRNDDPHQMWFTDCEGHSHLVYRS